MRARLRALDPRRADALIAVAALAEYLFELFVLVPGDAPYRGVAFAAVVVGAIGLFFRRTAPLAGATAVIGAVIVLELLPHEYALHMGGPYFASFVATLSLGLYASRAELIAGIGLTGAMLVTAQLAQPDYAGDAVFNVFLQILAPVLVGRLLRSRATLNRTLQEQTEALERARADAAGQAVADERTRIAGELHDVVAHALSAMTVQAGAARRLTAGGHAAARDAFAAVESTGRDALTELRRLLGVLRREDAEIALAPQPSLRHLGSLAERTSAAGLPVSLTVEGDLPELPAGLDLTGYRVVQEALAGALEPGTAGRAEVRLRMTADALELAVLDDGHGAEPRPLVAIRERVALHGGRLVAGPRRAGGHAVRARLPYDGEPMPEAEAVPERSAACPQTAARAAFAGRRGGSPLALAAAARAWARATLRALRRLEPLVVDRTIAAVVGAAAVAEVIVSPERQGPPLLNALVALGYALPVAWRRRAPLRAVAVVLAFALAMGLFLTSVEFLFAPFGTILALTYATAARLERRPALAGLGIAAAGALCVIATMDDQSAGDFIFPSLIVLGAWVCGRAVRSRSQLTARLHETAARLAEEHDAEAQRAASEERRRIAREMHDLVAHSMSVMVVQAGGARRIIGRDRGRALDAAVKIERTGREALTEMRHLLGVLHPHVEHAALAPQPTLAEVGALVERARAAGLPAVLHQRGERHALPAGLDLAAYRIVQEGLTNAIKHAAGAPTEVTVEWSEQAIALEVRDRGAGAMNGEGCRQGIARPGHGRDAGHGLVGMRERVRLYGGELRTGPHPDGGWHVRATLPCVQPDLVLT
jgi:signal transduction histidine kinase